MSEEWKFSENKKYAVNLEEEDVLFIRTDAVLSGEPLHPFLIEIENINDFLMPPSREEYRAYTFFKRFRSRAENDCLLFAEGMTINKFPYMDETCQFREKITGTEFGDSDEKNIEIAGEVRAFRECHGNIKNANISVNPEIGECYVIMVCEYIPNGYIPYHVAYVLFKDGTTNITIEANAGGNNKKPIFDIYSVGAGAGAGTSRPTFHETYKNIFVINAASPRHKIEPITCILEPI